MFEELKTALDAMCSAAEEKKPTALERYLQPAEDYGTPEGGKKAAKTRAQHCTPHTLTQYGTTVMIGGNGKPTREMPHWDNHDKSARQMAYAKAHGGNFKVNVAAA